jgi:Rap1a immunity proteins
MRTLAAAMIMACAVHQASAETTIQVHAWCKKVAEASIRDDGMVQVGTDFNAGFCWGAFGMLQGLSALVTKDGGRILLFCPPSSSTRLQFIQIFERYAEQHPEKGNLDFSVVARVALSEAFPCTSSDENDNSRQ